MLQDPDGFKSAIDKDDEAVVEARRLQDEADERLARELHRRDRLAMLAEEDRQRRRHEEERRVARARQEVEAAKRKEEQKRAKQREEIKRRQREDKLSLDTVHATTKPCPGCRWPIEKNDGCAHMTCKFRARFLLVPCVGIPLSMASVALWTNLKAISPTTKTNQSRHPMQA
jgi:hypothetical protein